MSGINFDKRGAAVLEARAKVERMASTIESARFAAQSNQITVPNAAVIVGAFAFFLFVLFV